MTSACGSLSKRTYCLHNHIFLTSLFQNSLHFIKRTRNRRIACIGKAKRTIGCQCADCLLHSLSRPNHRTIQGFELQRPELSFVFHPHQVSNHNVMVKCLFQSIRHLLHVIVTENQVPEKRQMAGCVFRRTGPRRARLSPTLPNPRRINVAGFQRIRIVW